MHTFEIRREPGQVSITLDHEYSFLMRDSDFETLAEKLPDADGYEPWLCGNDVYIAVMKSDDFTPVSIQWNKEYETTVSPEAFCELCKSVTQAAKDPTYWGGWILDPAEDDESEQQNYPDYATEGLQ